MRRKLFLLVAICFFFTACTSVSNLSEHVPANPATFEQHLAKGYADLARKEKAQADWMDAEYFADKGLNALEGKPVPPESLSRWPIQSHDGRQQLAWGRSRLDSLIDEDMKRDYPAQLAQAQVLYDCWVEREASNGEQVDLNRCRLDFLMAVSALENQLYLKKATPAQPADIPRTVKVEKVDEHYTIYFAFARASLDTKAFQIVEDVMQSLGKMDDFVLELSGHTDTAGPKEFNKKLSRARAHAVAEAFVQRGVNKDKIYQRYYGEEELAVKTPDDTPNRKNRRVVIDLSSRP